MNLRQPVRINEPIIDNYNYRIHTCYTEDDFETWISIQYNINLISITYLIDNILTNNTNYKQDMTSSNDTGNEQYSYMLKILYQEK